MRLKYLLFNQELDKALAMLGIVISILLIIYTSVVIGRMTYALTGFFTFISCIIWLRIRTKASLEISHLLPSSLNLLSINIFFIIFILSILLIYFRPELYERPLIYFITISLMVAVIVIESFSLNAKNKLILLQIILIGISLSWSQLLIFPSLIGSDSSYHQMFTLKILNEYFIPDGYAYSEIPIFHLFIGITSLITGFNYKYSTMLSVSLSQVICDALFIYLMGKFLFKSNKIGLLASLLVIISNHHIFMSYWSIPHSFATIFTLPIFYFSMKLKSNKSINVSFLTIFLLVIIILTHPMVSMFTAISLFIFWVSFNLYNFVYYKVRVPISLTYIFLFTVSMFAWWSYASGRYLRTLARLIKWGFSVDYTLSTPSAILTKFAAAIPISEEIFNNVGMFLFFALSFIGCFYMISKKYGNHDTFAIAITGMSPLFIGFFSLITQRGIIQDRWWCFAEIYLSIPLAVAFVLLCNYITNDLVKRFFLVALTVLLSFIMIMNPAANCDNPIFSPNSAMRNSLTASELQAVSTVSNISNNVIKTDAYYAGYYQFDYKVKPFDNEVYSKDLISLQDKMVLTRETVIGKSFKLFSSIGRLDYNLRDQLDKSNFSRIYDCGSVESYLFINSNSIL